MKFPAAWAKVRGQAYVGMIEGRPPALHEDLGRNYRAQFDNCAVAGLCGTNQDLGDVSTAHSTHVAGIVAAQTNNQTGVAGACPECSTAAFALNGSNLDEMAARAILAALDSGMQVINWSGSIDINAQINQFNDCGSAPQTCDAMLTAKKRDVLLVQAAGNFNQERPPFPSFLYQDYWVLPVGGTAIANPRPGDRVGTQGVIAPAKSILSTFRPGDFIPSNEPDANCGDTVGLSWPGFGHLVGRDESGTPNDGYGTCTGTSMAAPHVSALAGLVRSVNPLLSADQVRQIIRNSGNQASASTKTVDLGWGLPDASKAVDAALATNPTRLTPLFSFYSADRADSFYTTVPQMARAAIGGTLAPRRSSTETHAYNSDYGITVGGYAQFPAPIPAGPAWFAHHRPSTARRGVRLHDAYQPQKQQHAAGAAVPVELEVRRSHNSRSACDLCQQLRSR
jgi:serine protease